MITKLKNIMFWGFLATAAINLFEYFFILKHLPSTPEVSQRIMDVLGYASMATVAAWLTYQTLDSPKKQDDEL